MVDADFANSTLFSFRRAKHVTYCPRAEENILKYKDKKIMYSPVNPSFTIFKRDARGSTLHGHVSMVYGFVESNALFSLSSGN